MMSPHASIALSSSLPAQLSQSLSAATPLSLLLELSSELSGEPAFGLRLAETRRLSTLGLLGLLMRERTGVCIAGTHGKSTTTAMTAAILTQAGHSPSVVVGAEVCGRGANGWGGAGEGYTWPVSNHGLTIDPLDNVWIGGNGQGDSHILKFTRDGRFLQQIGIPGQAPNSNTRDHFGRVAKVSFSPDGSEVFVADGYGNKRVAVLDARTGAVLWSRDVAAETETEAPTWGFSSSPLALGEAVIVAAGGTLAAYRAQDGEPIWTAGTPSREPGICG